MGARMDRNFRLAGFFGDEMALRELQGTAPALKVETVHESPNSFLRFRQETALAEADDHLLDGPREGEFSQAA